MRCWKPWQRVVQSSLRVSGVTLDLVEHRVTGALLDVNELDRLPVAIEEMLDLPSSEREALGQRAREHVIRRHSPSAESHSYAALYARARTTSR